MPPGYDEELYDQATYGGTSPPVLPPSLISLTPNTGAVGTPVLIQGANFLTVAPTAGVKFGTTNATYSVVSDSQIQAVVPSMTTGAKSVTVINPNGTSNALTFTITAPAPPTISNFNPTTGATGSSFTITGTNFTTVFAVRVNGVDAAFTIASGTSITATVPEATTGPVTVVNPDGLYTTVSNFTVTTGPISPPPPLTVTSGLQHTFTYNGVSRQLPVLTSSWGERLADFEDSLNMRGGFMSATGVISEAEFTAYSAIYRAGATWVIQDAKSGRFIFGGELLPMQKAGGTVVLTAEGWGYGTEKMVERFLVSNMDVSQWTPADSDPFPSTIISGGENDGEYKYTWRGYARIEARVQANRLVFRVPRHTSFIRNTQGKAGPDSVPDAGNDWPSTPLMFWAPSTKLRWVRFRVNRRGGERGAYELQLVGTPTGPSGALSIIPGGRWKLGANRTFTVDFQVPGDYDCIGIRLTRIKDTSTGKDDETEKPNKDRGARKCVVYLEDVEVGSLATSTTYTLNQAFAEVFTRMGVDSTDIAASNQNVRPYDAARVRLSDIADDFATLGGWYWRVVADANGSSIGQAGPIGNTTWYVNLQQTPIEVYPQPQYNVVQYSYRYGGGYEGLATVRADPDPFPGESYVYVLELDEPPVKAIAEVFAQKVVDYLSGANDNGIRKSWYSGSATLFEVRTAASGGGDLRRAPYVLPGDKLVLENNGNARVIVDEVRHSQDGATTEVTFAESSGVVDKWLAQRQRRLNMGLSPDAATLLVTDPEEPAAPVMNTPTFVEHTRRHGHRDFNMNVTWQRVTEDIEGEGTAILRYHVKAHPVNASGVPIPNSQGGGWERVTVHAPREHDPILDVPTQAVIKNIPKPNLWRQEVYVRAEDVLGDFSAWSTLVTGIPADSYTAPPIPIPTFMEIDPRDVEVRWDTGVDPVDTTKPEPSVTFAQVELWMTRTPDYTRPNQFRLRFDKHVGAEFKRFRWDPNEYRKVRASLQAAGYSVDNYLTARIRNVDANNTHSAWAVISAILWAPPTPGAPSQAYFLSDGGAGRKLRVHVDYSDAYITTYEDRTDVKSDIASIAFRVQRCDLNPQRNPVRRYSVGNETWKSGAIPRPEEVVPGDKNDDFPGWSHHVHRGWLYRASARFIDRKGRKSGWSPWSGPIETTPEHNNYGQGMGYKATFAAAKNLNRPGRKANDASFTPVLVDPGMKGVLVDWDWPEDDDGLPDPEVSGFEVELSDTTGFTTVIARDRQVRNDHRRFEAKASWPRKPDGTIKGVYARARSHDSDGNTSDWTTSTTAAEAEEGVSSKPGDGSIDRIAQFAQSLRPIALVDSLPSLPDADYPEGGFVFLTADHLLYRVAGGVWTAQLPAELITSQIVTGQIRAGAITATEIAANAVWADKLAVDALIGQHFATALTGVNRIVINGRADKDRIVFESAGNSTAMVATNQGIQMGASAGAQLSFFGATPTSRATAITGARSTQLQNIVNQLLQALNAYGLIVNSTTQ